MAIGVTLPIKIGPWESSSGQVGEKVRLPEPIPSLQALWVKIPLSLKIQVKAQFLNYFRDIVTASYYIWRNAHWMHILFYPLVSFSGLVLGGTLTAVIAVHALGPIPTGGSPILVPTALNKGVGGARALRLARAAATRMAAGWVRW